MKILMLGWEFPPNISGGLGIASQGIAEALTKAGTDVTFLLPKKHKNQVSKKVKLLDASAIKPDFSIWKTEQQNIEVIKDIEIGQYLMAYLPARKFTAVKEKQQVTKKLEKTDKTDLLNNIELTGTYGENLHSELMKYALLTMQVAKKEKIDAIHAHDWVTFKAGIMASQLTGIPLFVHIHSTEYDRNGAYAQSFVVNEERSGLKAATHVFCVSELQSNVIHEKYNIPKKKITVVPNAVEIGTNSEVKAREKKHIAFVGRLTYQKSPGTFVEIARELTTKGHDFRFSIIGDGFLRGELEEKIKSLNLTERFTFTGFLDRPKLLQKMSTIDLLVVPSVSEPFGLVILEAILKHIPVVAASGVGVADYIPSLPQIDRWDIYSYVNEIEKILSDDQLRKDILQKCSDEAKKLTWESAAAVVVKSYSKYGA